MRRRDLLTLAGAVAIGGTAATGRRASAQQKSVLKASDVHPEGYPTVQAVENMGKKLEQATNGRLSIQMYASMQLGGEKEMIEQAQVGAIQLVRVSVGIQCHPRVIRTHTHGVRLRYRPSRSSP